MGQEVAARVFSRADRQRYREKVRSCLDVFARMLAEARFDAGRGSFGLEIELNLTDDDGLPALVNAAVLEAIADPDFQTELAQFNIEINVAPRRLEGAVLSELETAVRASLNNAEDRSRTTGAHMMIIGILPTVDDAHLNGDSLSANPRYQLLNEQIFAARGEDLAIDIRGIERLSTLAETIAPEAACTSVQLHTQVEPEAFARHWNASQAIAGVQVAVGANSPFFFGKELWRETRIALFEQATDTRPEELKAQGLRLHNGTIYRWNRPIYDVVRGRPHLRVENRILPAGPTVVDILANAAFYYGLIHTLVGEERPLWTQMSFSAAEENFHIGARDGIEARLYWPGL